MLTVPYLWEIRRGRKRTRIGRLYGNAAPWSIARAILYSIPPEIEMSGEIVSWAADKVKALLPGLGGEPLHDAVRYALSLSLDDADRHWRSLLGSSPNVESFIKQLRERRQEAAPSAIHSPTPQRRTLPPMSSSNSKGISPAETSRTPSPSKVLRITSNPARKKGPGKMTSDLGKQKRKPQPANPLAQAIEENRPLTELEEIDSALQSITITSKKRVACGCFGTTHEVFPLAPNCLTCGRIICVAEGIGDCFYCGEKLVSESQRDELVRELRLERGVAKTKASNEKVKKAKAGEARHRVWATKVGGQEWTSHESGGDSDSPFESGHITPLDQGNEYLEAERKRDELLKFDRTFAERTKIIGMEP